jgi:hypothetical protein
MVSLYKTQQPASRIGHQVDCRRAATLRWFNVIGSGAVEDPTRNRCFVLHTSSSAMSSFNSVSIR